MDGQSLNIKQTGIARLRELFPHIFSEDKVDPEKFMAAFGDGIDSSNERYTLNWAGKADAYRVLQERTTATLRPQPELSVNFDATENVFIEGENLEALKVLQKSYYNKIKCVIIDPPYNTGNDSFIYHDRFKENLGEYEKRVGERDEEGYLMKEGLFRKNSKENGHYHSNWLSMMFPRLFLARNLMRDDGVIFVHIDDNEVHNLRMVMNEVFGEENFVAEFVWVKKKKGSHLSKTTRSMTEYVLCYTKHNSEAELFGENAYSDKQQPLAKRTNAHKVLKFKPNIVNTTLKNGIYEAGKYGEGTSSIAFESFEAKDGIITTELIANGPFVWTQSKLDEEIENGTIVNLSSKFGFNVLRSDQAEKIKRPSTLIDSKVNVGTNEDAYDEIKEIFGSEGIMSYPKPVSLIKYLVNSITYFDRDAVILDFFAGSATTAHAVLSLNQEDGGNRKFILVQLPELCDKDSEAYKSGYKTIADISRERIRRVIQKLGGGGADSGTGTGGLGFRSYKLSPSNFKIWRSDEVTEENLESQMDAFIDPAKPESRPEDMLVELILKSGYKLTEKFANCGGFYYINNELVIALTEMTPEIAAEIMNLSPKPQKVIVLDRLFAGDDELKTNTALQMRDAGVGFRTI